MGMGSKYFYSKVYKYDLLIKKIKSILLHSLKIICGIQKCKH